MGEIVRLNLLKPIKTNKKIILVLCKNYMSFNIQYVKPVNNVGHSHYFGTFIVTNYYHILNEPYSRTPCFVKDIFNCDLR